jgi:hypothetical protein
MRTETPTRSMMLMTWQIFSIKLAVFVVGAAWWSLSLLTILMMMMLL